MIQLLGKFLETGEKVGSVFGKALINLEKDRFSFWEDAEKLGNRWFSCGKNPWATLHTILWTWLCLVPRSYTSSHRASQYLLMDPSRMARDCHWASQYLLRDQSWLAGDCHLMGWFWVDLLIFFPHTIAFVLAATTGCRVLVPRCTTEVRVAWV